MSDDVTVTDRDRAKAYEIAKEWVDYPVDLEQDIALALAQARSDGAEPVKLPCGHTRAENLDTDGGCATCALIRSVSDLESYTDELETRADVAEEALRVAVGSLKWIIQDRISMTNTWNGQPHYTCELCTESSDEPDTIQHVRDCPFVALELTATLTPTTASTKTDAKECKEDLVEFLQAAWDPDTGFTNSNGFYRQLGLLYEKYCGAETAGADASEDCQWETLPSSTIVRCSKCKSIRTDYREPRVCKGEPSND